MNRAHQNDAVRRRQRQPQAADLRGEQANGNAGVRLKLPHQLLQDGTASTVRAMWCAEAQCSGDSVR